MPRGKQTRYALADDGSGGLTQVRVDGGGSDVSSIPPIPDPEAWRTAAWNAYATLDARTDGWLRHIPSGDGKQCYAKWKYTRGPHAGKYVMFQAPGGAWYEALVGLAYKVAKVDEGLLKPAHDTFYDPR